MPADIPASHHPAQKRVVAQVSEATRRAAQSPSRQSADLQKEYDGLVALKISLQDQLTKYSKSSLAKEQLDIRRQYRNNQSKSIEAWIERKSQLEQERRELVHRVQKIEQRLIEMKPRMQRLKEEQTNNGGSNGILRDILREMQLMRADFKRFADSTPQPPTTQEGGE